jgi:hypothetical protein
MVEIAFRPPIQGRSKRRLGIFRISNEEFFEGIAISIFSLLIVTSMQELIGLRSCGN